jgi:acetyl-CoA decarbonylase/synthase complex subunit gamma
MRYRVDPGLYSLGTSTAESPVFVTANYKLSFDLLRKNCASRDAWVLVIDTAGINVWCAAGKGAFSTKAIVKQITGSGLDSMVSHRLLILPQLAASGVAAHKVLKESGFTVKFGPVRASDLPRYLDDKYAASPAMRRVRFSFLDRSKLVPMEALPALRKVFLYLLGAAILFGITRTGVMYKQAVTGVLPLVTAGLTAVFTGSVLTPLFLPMIPFRAFSLKGLLAGLIGAIAIIFFLPVFHSDPFLTALCLTAVPSLSSFFAFLFTGSSTYTSPSGVKKELKTAWPLYLVSGGVSVVLFAVVLIRFWGIL